MSWKFWEKEEPVPSDVEEEPLNVPEILFWAPPDYNAPHGSNTDEEMDVGPSDWEDEDA